MGSGSGESNGRLFSQRLALVAISDDGMGANRHVSRAYPVDDARTAINLALQPRHRGDTSPGSLKSGCGLCLTSGLCAQGRLHALTGRRVTSNRASRAFADSLRLWVVSAAGARSGCTRSSRASRRRTEGEQRYISACCDRLCPHGQ